MKLKQGCLICSDYGLNISAEEYTSEGVPIIRTSDMNNSGALDLSNTKYVDPHVVGTKRLSKGDILFSRSGTIGRAMVFDADLDATYAAYLVRFRPHPKRLIPKFIGYWAQSAEYWQQICMDTIQSTIGNFNANKFANLSIPEHDLATQCQIVDLLDHKTAQIDALIEKNERLISLVQEKQDSFLSTFFNKESGMISLKRLAQGPLASGLGLAADQDDPENPRYIRTTDIATPWSLKNDTFMSFPKEIASKAPLVKNDVVFASAGTVGKSYIHKIDGDFCYAGFLVRFRASKACCPDYVLLWSLSQNFRDQVEVNSVKSTISNLSAGRYANLKIPHRSLEEQKRVVDIISPEIKKMNLLVDKVRKMNSLLREKRSALITAAVTGQIDIPEE